MRVCLGNLTLLVFAILAGCVQGNSPEVAPVDCGGTGRQPDDSSSQANEGIDPVRAALDWLGRHQEPEGYWLAGDRPVPEERATPADVFVTGLALGAFASAAFDHKIGPYTETIRQGVLWLRSQQSLFEDGGFVRWGTADGVRAQAAATMALAELYGVSGDSALRPTIELANDWLVTWLQSLFNGHLLEQAWAVMALKSSDMAGLHATTGREGVRDILRELLKEAWSTERYDWNESEILPPDRGDEDVVQPLRESAWGWVALATGIRERRDPLIDTFVSRLKQHPPAWQSGQIEFQYWFWATRFIFQVHGVPLLSEDNTWGEWHDRVNEVLHGHQNLQDSPDSNPDFGSWAPVDAWGPRYGRVYATAINVQTLQIYYR